jgi:hypothetical protein
MVRHIGRLLGKLAKLGGSDRRNVRTGQVPQDQPTPLRHAMIARSIGNLFNRKFATALVDDQLVIRHVAGINH